MKIKQIALVACQPHRSPGRVVWEVFCRDSELRTGQELVQGPIEILPYPRHLKQPNWSVVVNENALDENLPYNRWGLAGSFFVTRFDRHGRQQSLSASAVNQVIHDLANTLGYLDARSGVANFFREQGMDREPPDDPFFFLNPNWQTYFKEGRTRRSLPAPEYRARGGHWTPQLHFTGAQEIEELRFVESMLDQYAENIVAHSFSFPIPGMYSVELQFGLSESDQAAMVECQRRYEDRSLEEEDEFED